MTGPHVIVALDIRTHGMVTFEWAARDSEGLVSAPAEVGIYVQCSPGYIRVEGEVGKSSCEPCPAGQFNQAGQLDQELCFDCDPGRYSPIPAQTECVKDLAYRVLRV